MAMALRTAEQYSPGFALRIKNAANHFMFTKKHFL
jgi:hypothetical protein